MIGKRMFKELQLSVKIVLILICDPDSDHPSLAQSGMKRLSLTLHMITSRERMRGTK
jgi:hypothetical protein